MEIKAITLVYFNESSRLRKDSGMTISLQHAVSDRIYRGWTSILDDDIHEASDPEMTVNQKANSGSILTEALNNPRHQITNNDKIADPDPEAFYGDSGIKYDSSVGIGDLGKGEKGGRSSLKISGAPCLEIETKACCETRP